jgi:hypothetical protein
VQARPQRKEGKKSEAEKLFEKGEQALQQLEREREGIGEVTVRKDAVGDTEGKYRTLTQPKERLVPLENSTASPKWMRPKRRSSRTGRRTRRPSRA